MPLVVLVGIFAFAGSAAVGLLLGIPAPNFQDEFSYLLAADTFAHGRVANPTHPMWIHFESMHIIQQPTYMSKYPPAQGLVLAVGQILTGYPIVGVWISMGIMCAAVCWMLQVWVSRRWALIGAILTLVHPELGIAGMWSQTYWGGAVATTGGALVLGGLRSLIKKKNLISAVILGIGVAILANSRPYEGLVLIFPIAVALFVWLFSKNGPSLAVSFKNVLLPLCLVIGLSAGAMAAYNFKITGNIFRLPYQVHEESYSTIPIFAWQKLRPVPHYNHQTLRDFHLNYGLTFYQAKQSLPVLLKVNFAVWIMYFLLAGSVVALPLIAAAKVLVVWIFRNRWACFAILTYAVFGLGIMVETYSNLYYFAPIIPLNYYFIVQAMRLWRWRTPQVAKPMVRIVPMLSVAVLSINVWQLVKNSNELTPHTQRAGLLAQLKRQPGRHLILVKYGPNHPFEHEWVYNEADIDASRVVWARNMDTPKNCELINYFKDRVIWSLNIDRDEELMKLSLYPKQTCASHAARDLAGDMDS